MSRKRAMLSQMVVWYQEMGAIFGKNPLEDELQTSLFSTSIINTEFMEAEATVFHIYHASAMSFYHILIIYLYTVSNKFLCGDPIFLTSLNNHFVT